MKINKKFLSSCLVLCSVSAFSDPKSTDELTTELRDSFNYGISTTFLSNFKERGLSEHFSSLIFSPYISSSYVKRLPVTVSLMVNKSLVGEKKATLGNTVISTSGRFNNYFGYSSSLILPTSEASRKVKKNLFSLVNGINFSESRSFNNGVSINATVMATHNFSQFKYKTDIYGSSNNVHSFSELLSLSTSYKKVSFGFTFGVSQNFSHNWTMTEGYFSSESLRVGVSNNLSLSLVHSNGGSLLAPNGEDLGIDLFDRDNDTFSVNASFNF